MKVIAFTSQHETTFTKPISLSQGHTFPSETRLLTRIKCSERRFILYVGEGLNIRGLDDIS